MAFNRQSATTPSAKSDASAAKNKAAGYLNISVVTKDGSTKRLGNSGIPLREGHPLEGAILEFCKNNPDRVQELAGRLQISFVETLPEGTVYDLGI